MRYLGTTVRPCSSVDGYERRLTPDVSSSVVACSCGLPECDFPVFRLLGPPEPSARSLSSSLSQSKLFLAYGDEHEEPGSAVPQSAIGLYKTHFWNWFRRELPGGTSFSLVALMLAGLGMAWGQGIVTTIAGNGQAAFGGDGGSGTKASLKEPLRVALDAAGNLFIADTANNRIRKVTPDGTITTFAGNGKAEFSGDGGPAVSAGLNAPGGVYADAFMNVFISDTRNNRIRKVGTNGSIFTVAGNGQNGFSGDGGPATNAVFAFPTDITGDGGGNLYVLDFNNFRARKIGTDGSITTVAGGGTAGPKEGASATESFFGGLFGVALDPAGNIYLATGLLEIVEVKTSGIVHHTGVGLGFNGVFGLVTDPAGNLYIADPTANKIAKYSTTGAYSIIAGTGTAGFSGDGGPPLAATFNLPLGLTIDPQGALYVVDSGNQRIRKITPPPSVSALGTVNAASFQPGAVAAAEFISLFGTGFSTQVVPASALPLPGVLDRVNVKFKDSAGTEIVAPLQLVAPTQINCVVPENLKAGPVTITVAGTDGQTSAASLNLASVAPGVFSANANGKGVAAANALRVSADNTQTPEPLFECGGAGCVPVAIDLGQNTDQTYLTLYGTGIRGRASLSDVAVQIGGVLARVLYAGPQGAYAGLDQINLIIPQSLRGVGQVDVVLSVGSAAANTLNISIQ